MKILVPVDGSAQALDAVVTRCGCAGRAWPPLGLARRPAGVEAAGDDVKQADVASRNA